MLLIKSEAHHVSNLANRKTVDPSVGVMSIKRTSNPTTPIPTSSCTKQDEAEQQRQLKTGEENPG